MHKSSEQILKNISKWLFFQEKQRVYEWKIFLVEGIQEKSIEDGRSHYEIWYYWPLKFESSIDGINYLRICNFRKE